MWQRFYGLIATAIAVVLIIIVAALSPRDYSATPPPVKPAETKVPAATPNAPPQTALPGSTPGNAQLEARMGSLETQLGQVAQGLNTLNSTLAQQDTGQGRKDPPPKNDKSDKDKSWWQTWVAGPASEAWNWFASFFPLPLWVWVCLLVLAATLIARRLERETLGWVILLGSIGLWAVYHIIPNAIPWEEIRSYAINALIYLQKIEWGVLHPSNWNRWVVAGVLILAALAWLVHWKGWWSLAYLAGGLAVLAALWEAIRRTEWAKASGFAKWVSGVWEGLVSMANTGQVSLAPSTSIALMLLAVAGLIFLTKWKRIGWAVVIVAVAVGILPRVIDLNTVSLANLWYGCDNTMQRDVVVTNTPRPLNDKPHRCDIVYITTQGDVALTGPNGEVTSREAGDASRKEVVGVATHAVSRIQGQIGKIDYQLCVHPHKGGWC